MAGEPAAATIDGWWRLRCCARRRVLEELATSMGRGGPAKRLWERDICARLVFRRNVEKERDD